MQKQGFGIVLYRQNQKQGSELFRKIQNSTGSFWTFFCTSPNDTARFRTHIQTSFPLCADVWSSGWKFRACRFVLSSQKVNRIPRNRKRSLHESVGPSPRYYKVCGVEYGRARQVWRWTHPRPMPQDVRLAEQLPDTRTSRVCIQARAAPVANAAPACSPQGHGSVEFCMTCGAILNTTLPVGVTPWMRSTVLHVKVIQWAEAKGHVHSDSVLCLRKMQEPPEANVKCGKINFKTSNSPTNAENFLGSMENPLSSSGIFCHELQHCRFSKRFKTNWKLVKQVQKNLKIDSSIRPCSMILIGLIIYDFRKRSRITQKRVPLWYWSFIGPGEENKWCATHTDKPERQWKKSLMSCWKISRKVDIRYSEVPVRSIKESHKEKVEDVRFTSLRNLRIQSSYFARFTQQISSVFAEQWQVGVENWLSWYLVNHI